MCKHSMAFLISPHSVRPIYPKAEATLRYLLLREVYGINFVVSSPTTRFGNYEPNGTVWWQDIEDDD